MGHLQASLAQRWSSGLNNPFINQSSIHLSVAAYMWRIIRRQKYPVMGFSMFPCLGTEKPPVGSFFFRLGQQDKYPISWCTVHHPAWSCISTVALRYSRAIIKSQFVGKILGQRHVLHLETTTRDKAGPPPVQPLIPSVTCLPIHPFRTPNQRGDGGYPPSFWDLPRGVLHPSSTLSIKSDPPGSALCVLTMLLVGPVTVFSVAFTRVVFLLYSEVSLHHGNHSFRQGIYPQLGGRFV